jgi:hypothetical protein
MNTEILVIIGMFAIGLFALGLFLGLLEIILRCVELFKRVEIVEKHLKHSVNDRLDKIENKGVKK